MDGSIAVAAIALTALVAFSGCGGGEGTTGDAATEDTGPGDAADGVDAATDPPADPAADDLPPDAGPDGTEDPPADGLTECEEAGGYCTQYAVIPDPCVTCDSTGEIHYRPAHRSLGAMGCTVEGVGTSPWCCLPHEPTTLTDCDTAGGECYPTTDPEPCPPGWGMIYSSCGGEGLVCCAPASENCI